MENAHAGEASDLYLKGDVGRQVNVNLSLACRVSTNILSATKDSTEALVPDLINHFAANY